MHTCYSGGDVGNIKVPFGIAVREIALMKRVRVQHGLEETYLQEIKWTNIYHTAEIKPLINSLVHKLSQKQGSAVLKYTSIQLINYKSHNVAGWRWSYVRP